jgi:hypothetical protein
MRFFHDPKVFLKSGDVCRLTIDGIGVLETRVEAIPSGSHVEFRFDLADGS